MRHLSSASEGAEAMSQHRFRARLDTFIDLSPPSAKLVRVTPSAEIKPAVSLTSPPTLAGAGRPTLPIRLTAGLLYLKHAYNLSDEATCERWLHNCYRQYFTSEVYFQTLWPCEPSSFTRWRNGRNRLGESGLGELLSQTIEAADTMRAVVANDLRRGIIATTAQEKAIAYPTDSRLLEIARQRLVQLAQQKGITLRQSYEREGLKLQRCAGGYAHVKQYKRLKRVLGRQRTVLGRVIRDIEPKIDHATASTSLRTMLARAGQLRVQHREAKDELHALHALEVKCISKGQSRYPYEFGVKVSIPVAARGRLVVGARRFPGNLCDRDTLADQLEQAEILSGEKPKTAIVVLGYRGRSVEGMEILHPGKTIRLTRWQWSWVRRCQAIEPTIGHLKDGYRLRRNRLKYALGDALHVLACAAGYNLLWLPRWIAIFLVSIWRPFTGIFGLPNPEIGIRAA